MKAAEWTIPICIQLIALGCAYGAGLEAAEGAPKLVLTALMLSALMVVSAAVGLGSIAPKPPDREDEP